MKYQFKAKKDKASFYHNITMVGERLAVETLDSIETILNQYGTTKLQKLIIKNTINLESMDWSYFAGGRSYFSKKNIANLKMVLKQIDKKYKNNLAALLQLVENRTGMLKNPLIHILEYLAYNYDKKNYEDHYCKCLSYYGGDEKFSKDRLKNYITKLSKDIIQ